MALGALARVAPKWPKGSCQPSQNKCFDPSTSSMRKIDDREGKKEKPTGTPTAHANSYYNKINILNPTPICLASNHQYLPLIVGYNSNLLRIFNNPPPVWNPWYPSPCPALPR